MVPGRCPKHTRDPHGRLSTGWLHGLDRGDGSWHTCPVRYVRPRGPLSRLMADAFDLVHPRECLVCLDPADVLCRACAGRLGADPFAHRPSPCPPGYPPVYAAVPYDGPARQAILEWKERGQRGMAGALGMVLASAVSAGLQASGIVGHAVLVPIPPSRHSLRARGEDVLARVARAAARELRAEGISASVRSSLVLVRTPRDQAVLDARARQANLSGAMSGQGAIRSGAIVLVDDIVTTGATLAEAARALTESGRPPQFAAAIAATLRKCGHP